LALRSTFRDDLVIAQGLNDWAMNELATRITPANELRDLEEFIDPNNEDLFPHQRAGVKFLATAKRALLADEPGLGKTAQAIRALKELKEQGEDAFPALIVCPNTLKKNWAREFDVGRGVASHCESWPLKQRIAGRRFRWVIRCVVQVHRVSHCAALHLIAWA
jgi:N12 class adenine-specific DNA methylase